MRIKVVHLETTAPKVLTLRLDLKYWPTYELSYDDASAAWARIQH